MTEPTAVHTGLKTSYDVKVYNFSTEEPDESENRGIIVNRTVGLRSVHKWGIHRHFEDQTTLKSS